MRTAKEIKNSFKKAVKAIVKLKAQRNKLQAQHDNLVATNTASEGELNHLLSKIEFLNCDINRLKNAMQQKSEYFEVGLTDLVNAFLNELRKENPDEKVEVIAEAKCEITKTKKISTQFCYGAMLFKSGKKFMLPAISVKDQKATPSEYLRKNKKVNLLKLGLLQGDCEEFKGKGFQKSFWQLVENNLQAKVDAIRDGRGYAIQNAKNDCADKINKIGNLGL